MLTVFLRRRVFPPIRSDRDLFLMLGASSGVFASGAGSGIFAFGAGSGILASGADHDRAWCFVVDRFVMNLRRGSMSESVSGTVFRKKDHFVRLRVAMPRRRRPFRAHRRTRRGSRPIPVPGDVKPSFVIRDVFVPVKNVAVFRDRDFSGSRHDDRFPRGRGDRRDGFHDDRFLHDPRFRLNDDRSGTGFDDSAHQIHDVRGKLNAVCRGSVAVTGEGCRSKDCRCGECGADSECLVESLLGRVSFGCEVVLCSKNILFLDS